jgi:hypothetical protein
MISTVLIDYYIVEVLNCFCSFLKCHSDIVGASVFLVVHYVFAYTTLSISEVLEVLFVYIAVYWLQHILMLARRHLFV